LAANKSDLFDKERVSEERARKFAEEIGATFKLTSACTSAGVEELFISCGCRFLDPNYKEDENKKPVAKVVEESKNEQKPEEENKVSEKKKNKLNDSIKLSENAVRKKSYSEVRN
jgi:hypothetical protein